MKDRLIRLGIPLVVYCWILRPLLIYLGLARSGTIAQSFWSWFTRSYFKDNGIIGGGPLWFIETLLIFSAVYALWRLITRSRPAARARDVPFPGAGAIVLCALLIGLVTFAVRIAFPVGSAFKPLNLQLANFVQYIVMFILGLIAYRHNWLMQLPARTGRLWLWASAGLIIAYPVLAVLAGATENQEPFMGGLHWQALLYSMWEAFVCLSMCIGVIYLFRARWNHQGKVAKWASRRAYTAYLIHEPVITVLAVATAGAALYPLLKFGLASLIFVPITFALSDLVFRIPGADRVL